MNLFNLWIYAAVTFLPILVWRSFCQSLVDRLPKLFEPEGSQKFQASSLDSRDAGIWKRIMTGSATAGTLASLQAIISALSGAYYLTVVAAPLAVLSLASAGLIWADLSVTCGHKLRVSSL